MSRLEPSIQRSIGYAILDASTQSRTHVEVQNLIVGLAIEFGNKLERHLRPADRMRLLIPPDRVEKITNLAKNPQALIKDMPGNPLEKETAAALDYFKKSPELETVFTAATKYANERKDAWIIFEDVLAALSRSADAKKIFDRYGLSLVLTTLGQGKTPENRILREAPVNETGNVSPPWFLSKFEQWRVSDQLLHVSLIAGHGSPDTFLGTRVELDGKVTLVDSFGLVRITGSSSECLIDLRGSNIAEEAVREEGDHFRESGRMGLDLVLASGDRCRVLTSGPGAD